MPFCRARRWDSLALSVSGTILSSLPWMIRPDEGQGARKPKSYMLAGGATAMKPSIRSEERSVGKECVRKCRSRGSASYYKQYKLNNTHHIVRIRDNPNNSD